MKPKMRLLAFVLAPLGLVLVGLMAFRAIHDRSRGAEMPASGAAIHLWHCGMHPQVIQDHPGDCPICHMALTPVGSDNVSNAKVYAESASPQISIDPRVVQNMGVRTAAVTRGPLSSTLVTSGMLKIPEPAMHDVSLKVGGWIDKLHADQDGMHVARGEVLFDLYSPELQVAAQELIGAVKSQQALDAAPSQALRRDGNGMVESAKRKLRLWDIAEEDIDAISKADAPPKTIPFRSPAMGHIANKTIVQGSPVQPMMKLMRIEDHSKLWLDAVVYENQLASIAIGQRVVASIGGLPGKSWKGAITFLYPHVDPMTRTLNVRMTLDNPDLELRPGMYATVQIVTEPVPDAIQIPREAVIDTGMRQLVFIAEGDGHFSPRKVRMGMMGDDDRVQIVEGLAPGETVVTSGQFLMDVESRTIEATQKLSETPTNERSSTQPGMKAATEPAMDMAHPSMESK